MSDDAIQIPVAAGELIDKITILEIKSEQIRDEQKLANVRCELALLAEVRDRQIEPSPQLDSLTTELKQINLALWHIEDGKRGCERSGDFGDKFIQLARSVYFKNDQRAAVKRRINELLGSRIVEEKDYQPYA